MSIKNFLGNLLFGSNWVEVCTCCKLYAITYKEVRMCLMCVNKIIMDNNNGRFIQGNESDKVAFIKSLKKDTKKYSESVKDTRLYVSEYVNLY